MKTKFFSCLVLVAALAFTACPTTPQKDKNKKAAATSKLTGPDESGDVDFQSFIGRLRMAVAAHDANVVASMMTVDFGYRLNPEASGPGVFQYWDENNLWGELNGVLAEHFVPKDNYMVSPPQFADPAANYDGYRAGMRRVNGSWKFAYFVNG